ncbi:MAG: hypothetical protein Q8O72_05950 [Bacteroidales bacterium]|nr:hypothetical protein [Bacteroidales bacterium]
MILLTFISQAQTEMARIAVDTRKANGIYEKHNNLGIHCFYINLTDKYLFVVTDSTFNEIFSKEGNFYSGIKPDFVGCIATDSTFVFFFNRVAENDLMVLTVNCALHKVTVIKSFKPFSSRDYKARKFINHKNRFIILTLSKKLDLFCLFEIKHVGNIEKHIMAPPDAKLLDYVEKGLFESYGLEEDKINVLVYYYSLGERVTNYHEIQFDLANDKCKALKLSLDAIDINPNHLFRYSRLTGTTFDTCIMISSFHMEKKKQVQLLVFSLNTGIPLFNGNFNIQDLVDSNAIRGANLDFRKLISGPLDSNSFGNYPQYPLYISVFDKTEDTIKLRFMYSIPLYDSTEPSGKYLLFSMNLSKDDFHVFPDNRDNLQQFNEKLTYAGSKSFHLNLLEYPIVEYNNMQLFTDNHQRNYFCTIDKKQHELVIEWLNFEVE